MHRFTRLRGRAGFLNVLQKIGVLAAAVCSLCLGAASTAAAQSYGDGVLGWNAPIPGGGADYWPSAMQACQTQYNRFGFSPSGPFEGYTDTSPHWLVKQCKWVTHPGSVYPAPTTFNCQYGYTAIQPGRCVKDNIPSKGSCSTNNGAQATPRTGFPIEIVTGSKIFKKIDFQTGDGALLLGRWFTSAGYEGVSADYYAMRAPVGFANWRASWAIQLTISSVNYPNHWLVTFPSGRAVSFQHNTDGSFTADNYTSAALPATDVKLAFVGTWPSSASAMQAAPTTWTVTDEDDNVWTLQTHLDPELGTYSIATPISMVDRDGLTRTFTYGSSGELTSISDSAGKAINFVWLYSDPSTVGGSGAKFPVAISEADLPDGSKILYSYTTMGVATTGLLWPDVLTKVEFHDVAGALQDAENYNYGDSRFPWFVTDVLDKNGVTRWSATYDSAGRAVTSQGPGGAFANSVSYTPYNYTFTRTVTNALGKQAIYQFAYVGSWGESKLTGVNGQASTHCVASNSSYTYDSNTFISSVTDEEGRVTAYTRNSRGLPTQIIEAQGTPTARTTNITWHSMLSIPTEIVAPGRTTDFTYTSAP